MMLSHPNGGVGRRAATAASCPPPQAQPDKDGMIPLKEHLVIPGFLQELKPHCWESFASSEPASPELKAPLSPKSQIYQVLSPGFGSFPAHLHSNFCPQI